MANKSVMIEMMRKGYISTYSAESWDDEYDIILLFMGFGVRMHANGIVNK